MEFIDAYIIRGVLEGSVTMETYDQFNEVEIEELIVSTEIMKRSAEKNQHKRVINRGGEFHDQLINKNKNSNSSIGVQLQ